MVWGRGCLPFLHTSRDSKNQALRDNKGNFERLWEEFLRKLFSKLQAGNVRVCLLLTVTNQFSPNGAFNQAERETERERDRERHTQREEEEVERERKKKEEADEGVRANRE